MDRVRVLSTFALAAFVLLRAGVAGSDEPSSRATPTAAAPRPAARPVQVRVQTIVPTASGMVVLLRTIEGETYLPIWVGEAEAYSIHLRLAHQAPPRPLTHDLLDTVLRTLDAQILRVTVVDIRDGVFIGRVDLRGPNHREHRIDARSSDSIALAVGAGVPIFVAAHVLRQAGVDRATLEREGYQGTPIPLEVHSL